MTLFYGSGCCLSNFTFMPFAENKGVYYHSQNNFCTTRKILLPNDVMSAVNILAAKTPSKCKSLGGRVTNVEIERSKRHTTDIMQIGLSP